MRTADDYYIGLVQKAQSGERDSVNKLAEAVVERLRAYICRLTLDRDQTEDIVQETILEMFRVLGKLRKADRFWPWLYGIAFNKVRHHQRAQATRRSSEISGIKAQADAGKAGLETLITDELKQIVRAAMNRLKMQHRAVLAMRCYDEMSYSEIAESIGCSEFGARMLFCRAKRAMQKELSRAGLGKGALLTALLVFGKMTVPSEAAAATLSVTGLFRSRNRRINNILYGKQNRHCFFYCRRHPCCRYSSHNLGHKWPGRYNRTTANKVFTVRYQRNYAGEQGRKNILVLFPRRNIRAGDDANSRST